MFGIFVLHVLNYKQLNPTTNRDVDAHQVGNYTGVTTYTKA